MRGVRKLSICTWASPVGYHTGESSAGDLGNQTGAVLVDLGQANNYFPKDC